MFCFASTGVSCCLLYSIVRMASGLHRMKHCSLLGEFYRHLSLNLNRRCPVNSASSTHYSTLLQHHHHHQLPHQQRHLQHSLLTSSFDVCSTVRDTVRRRRTLPVSEVQQSCSFMDDRKRPDGAGQDGNHSKHNSIDRGHESDADDRSTTHWYVLMIFYIFSI